MLIPIEIQGVDSSAWCSVCNGGIMPLEEETKKELNRLAAELMQANAALRDQKGTTENAKRIIEGLERENKVLRQQLDCLMDKLIERATEPRGDYDD